MYIEKLNILIITARADFGGGPKHIYSLIKALHKNNNFYIACPDDIPYKKRYAEILGENKIIIIPHRKFSLIYLFKLKAFAGNNKIEIIHSHGKGAGIYGRFLSLLTAIPCVHTFHGIHIGSYNYYQKKIYLLVEKVLALKTKKFISVSNSEMEKAVELGLSPGSKITVIQNGVDVSQKKVTFNFNSVHLSTITRFDEAKNSELLISVANSLKKKLSKTFVIHVIGSGEREESVKSAVYKNGLSENFIFYGSLLNPAEILEKTNCYISTSIWEGLPLGALEAMSLGLPVIATNVVGNKDVVIHNKTGYLFNINDPDEAACFVIQLFNNERLWNEFSISAKERVEKEFSIKQMAEETNNLYTELLQKN
ncbi:MAG: glycosyltransferase [Ignavibacteria bacterium]|nr:glycosyltransferase [Ignavibacteria bacterium]